MWRLRFVYKVMYRRLFLTNYSKSSIFPINSVHTVLFYSQSLAISRFLVFVINGVREGRLFQYLPSSLAYARPRCGFTATLLFSHRRLRVVKYSKMCSGGSTLSWADVQPYQRTLYWTLSLLPTWRTRRPASYSCDALARYSAVFYPPLLSVLSSRLSIGSYGVYMISHPVGFANVTDVARSIGTEFRIRSSKIMIVVGDTWRTLKQPVSEASECCTARGPNA